MSTTTTSPKSSSTTKWTLKQFDASRSSSRDIPQKVSWPKNKHTNSPLLVCQVLANGMMTRWTFCSVTTIMIMMACSPSKASLGSIRMRLRITGLALSGPISKVLGSALTLGSPMSPTKLSTRNSSPGKSYQKAHNSTNPSSISWQSRTSPQ